MLNWLRKKLRTWILTEEEQAPSPQLACLIDGKQVIYRITGSHGFLLWGVSADGQRLIGEGIACDPVHYQKLWEMHNQGVDISWVDEPSDSP